MNIPQIRLESISAQISIHINKAEQLIEQPKAEVSIEQSKATMHIETTPSKLTIDQIEARADMDLKNISRRIKEAADKGKEDLLEGISRRVQEGEQFKRIENGGNVIAEIEKNRNLKPPQPANIKFIPSAGSVKIQYEPAKVNIEVKENKPLINVITHKPIIEYNPGEVEIGMKRINELFIDFEIEEKGGE
ncbi:DUF6470 family protein [Metabacillus sp. HB246100]